MKEATEENISLSAIPGDILRLVTDYIKHETIKLHMDLIEDILPAAVYLQMPDLIQCCSEFISHNMKAENVKMILGLAETLSLDNLKTKADEYVLTHISEFSETEDFKNLELGELLSLLDNDDLFVQDEKEVFNAAVKWLHVNRCDNSETCKEVLDTIRYPFLTESELNACIEELKDKGLHDLCSSFHDEASRFFRVHMHPHTKPRDYAYYIHTVKNKKMRARCEVDCLVACGGFTRSESATNKFQILQLNDLFPKDSTAPEEVAFRNMRDCRLPSKLCEHCTCVVDNFLYVVGGQNQYCQDGRYTVNTVFRFDPRYARWEQVRTKYCCTFFMKKILLPNSIVLKAT